MRWDALFDDLEAQAQALEYAERAGEVDTRTRGEVGRLAVLDRLRPAVGSSLQLWLAGGLAVGATLRRVGSDWLLLDEGQGREVVVPAAAVVRVRGLSRSAAMPDTVGLVESRLGLRSVLRGIARDRSAVRIHLSSGPQEHATVSATIDRVGADFVEVATHAAGEDRRRSEVRDVEMIAMATIAAVRRNA